MKKMENRHLNTTQSRPRRAALTIVAGRVMRTRSKGAAMAMALSSQGSMFTVACMLSIPPRSIRVIGIFTCGKMVIKCFSI